MWRRREPRHEARLSRFESWPRQGPQGEGLAASRRDSFPQFNLELLARPVRLSFSSTTEVPSAGNKPVDLEALVDEPCWLHGVDLSSTVDLTVIVACGATRKTIAPSSWPWFFCPKEHFLEREQKSRRAIWAVGLKTA